MENTVGFYTPWYNLESSTDTIQKSIFLSLFSTQIIESKILKLVTDSIIMIFSKFWYFSINDHGDADKIPRGLDVLDRTILLSGQVTELFYGFRCKEEDGSHFAIEGYVCFSRSKTEYGAKIALPEFRLRFLIMPGIISISNNPSKCFLFLPDGD